MGKAFGIGRGDGGKLAVRVDGVLFAKGNARSESRGRTRFATVTYVKAQRCLPSSINCERQKKMADRRRFVYRVDEARRGGVGWASKNNRTRGDKSRIQRDGVVTSRSHPSSHGIGYCARHIQHFLLREKGRDGTRRRGRERERGR